jgi:hypothetical protein
MDLHSNAWVAKEWPLTAAWPELVSAVDTYLAAHTAYLRDWRDRWNAQRLADAESDVYAITQFSRARFVGPRWVAWVEYHDTKGYPIRVNTMSRASLLEMPR